MIVDTHAHIIPAVDDGAVDIPMALTLLQSAYAQGVRHLFCTSHGAPYADFTLNYLNGFQSLQLRAYGMMPDLSLHTGCEVFITPDRVDGVVRFLKQGRYLPLGYSSCVLTEFSRGVTETEVQGMADCLHKAGYTPVLAHIERYPYLQNQATVDALIKNGCLIQINAYSLESERDEEIKRFARELTENGQIHFIGSDAHRTDYRSVELDSGVAYLREHLPQAEADAVLFRNAEKYLLAL